MEFIEKVVYINLDRRSDRRRDMEEELTRLGVPPEKQIRLPAVEQTPGWIGCCKSHRNVLQLAKDSGWANVLVLEDDFMSIVSPNELNNEVQTFLESGIPYDVVFLSYNLQQEEPWNQQMGRTRNCQTASGYLVHSRFFDTLLNNLTEAAYLAEQYPSHHWIYANDQYWKKLQETHIWLFFRNRLGKQRPGYSDLGGCLVDRGL
jgi:glycosyl transferase family 25